MGSHVGEGLLAVLIVLCVNVQNPDLEEAGILKIEGTIGEFLQATLHDSNRGSSVCWVIFLHPFYISTVKSKRRLPTKSRVKWDHFPDNRECSAQTHYILFSILCET